MKRARWTTLGSALIALTCLGGCASSDAPADDDPVVEGQQAEPASDYDSPPMGNPRPKKLPGDVAEEDYEEE